MAEVDDIIFHSLRTVGCKFDENIRSLGEITTDQVIEASVRCIQVITASELDLPMSLPPGMSARFRLGTSLANAVMGLGYRAEIGYQTFLYSSENDIRKLFMFLIEKLPKEASDTAEESLGASAVLQRMISKELGQRLACSWTPAYCKYRGARWCHVSSKWIREGCSAVYPHDSVRVTSPLGVGDLTKPLPKDVKAYYTKWMKFTDQQPPHSHQVIPSLLEKNATDFSSQQAWENEWNMMGLASRLSEQEYKAKKLEKIRKRISEHLRQGVQKSLMAGGNDLMAVVTNISDKSGANLRTKGSRFTHAEKLQFAQSDDQCATEMGLGEGPTVDSEKEIQQKREVEVVKLRDDLSSVSSKLESIDLDIKKFTAGIQQMEEEGSVYRRRNEEQDNNYRIKKRTLDLLPDAENNIKKLQNVVDGSAQRLLSLANQWENHRVPLIDEYRQLKLRSEVKVSETQTMLEEIKELRQKMKNLADSVREKEELQKQLILEYEQMAKDVNRSVYTQRIMEIVGNIKKQNEQIDKVLIDTKSIQKEINQLSGKLDRTFTVTDELIFKDAKRDEAVRKAYKYLAALHENCDILMKTVTETGELMREIRDLEDQIDNESNARIISNLEKITADYQLLQTENASMMAKLKK